MVVLVRGIGDIGSAVAHNLLRAGYGVVIHDSSKPTTTRRGMAFADAAFEEVKIFKPSPRVYHLAPEHLRVRPAEVGFVSSNCWDVAGAASAGLETFWIQRRAAEPPEELGFTADHTVRTITDLAALLRG